MCGVGGALRVGLGVEWPSISKRGWRWPWLHQQCSRHLKVDAQDYPHRRAPPILRMGKQAHSGCWEQAELRQEECKLQLRLSLS